MAPLRRMTGFYLMRQSLRLYLPFALAILMVTLLVGGILTRNELVALEALQKDRIALAAEIIRANLALPLEHLSGTSREPVVNRAMRLPKASARQAMEEGLVSLLYRNAIYDQARWILADGQEMARVRRGTEAPVSVPVGGMENESERQFFQHAVALPPGTLSVSAFDLSLEHGAVEIPLKPTIRFSIRLPTEDGEDLGILVFNVLGRPMLEQLARVMPAESGAVLMLLNPQGQWLLTPDQRDAFGFVLGETARSFASRRPNEWAQISGEATGRLFVSSGLWNWITINAGSITNIECEAAEDWKLVAHVPTAALAQILWELWWPLILMAAILLWASTFAVRKYRKVWEQREAGTAEKTLAEKSMVAERQLLLATEGARIGVWSWDLGSNKMVWSEQCKRHLALPSGMEPSMDHFYSVIHPDDCDRVKQAIETSLKERRDYYEEYRIIYADGSMRWMAAPGRVYTNADGSVESMGGVTMDVTDRKKAEEEVRELTTNLEQRVAQRSAEVASAERRFRLLAENASDVVLHIDEAGVITYITPSVTTKLGRTPDQLVGGLLQNIAHPAEWDALEALYEQLKKGTSASLELRLRIADNGYEWFSLLMRPLGSTSSEGFVGGLRDMQREVQVRETLAAERQRLRLTLENLFDPHTLMQPVRDKTGKITDFIYAEANNAACQWLGIDRASLLGKYMGELFPAVESSGLMNIYRETADTGRPTVVDEFPFPWKNGTRWLDIRAVRVDERLSFLWREVTEQHIALQKLSASEEQYRLLAHNSSDVVVRVDNDNKLVWVSPSLAVALGWEPTEWIGRRVTELAVDEQQLAMLKADLAQTREGQAVVRRAKLRSKSGTDHWIELHAGPYRDMQGRIDGIVGNFRVVDKEAAAEELLERQATTDALTGLLNRRQFENLARREIARARREALVLSLLMMDIDKFKAINDTHGHDAGDAVLRTLARACGPHLREEDLFARFGGEEFTILMPDTPIDGARRVAERIRETLGAEIVLVGEGKSVSFTVSIGVSQWSDPNEDLPALIKRADELLYRAKESGRNQVCAEELSS